jgi:hypothetical protein
MDGASGHYPLLSLINVALRGAAASPHMPGGSDRSDIPEGHAYGIMASAASHLHALERQMLELCPRLSTLTLLLKTLILPAMPWLSIEASERVQSEVSEAAQAAASAAQPLMELVSLLPAAPLVAVGAAGQLSEPSRVAASMSSGRDAWLWSQQGSTPDLHYEACQSHYPEDDTCHRESRTGSQVIMAASGHTSHTGIQVAGRERGCDIRHHDGGKGTNEEEDRNSMDAAVTAVFMGVVDMEGLAVALAQTVLLGRSATKKAVLSVTQSVKEILQR